MSSGTLRGRTEGPYTVAFGSFLVSMKTGELARISGSNEFRVIRPIRAARVPGFQTGPIIV